MASARRPWYRPRRSRRSQRWALALVVISLVLAGTAIRGAYQTMLAYPDRPGNGTGEIIEVEIPQGSSFPKVLELLQRHGVIAADEGTAFKLFVLHNGAANKTTAGRHRFRDDMTPTEILEELQRRQRVDEVSITIAEGKHMLQIAEQLAGAGLADQASLIAAMRDPVLLQRLGIDAPTVEGRLFPDTYKFQVGAEGASAEKIVERLVRRHDQVYDELYREHREAGRRLDAEFGWGHTQIVTLASIVEKETGVEAERPRIAGVFLNRLRSPYFQPKLLQTDPTIIYGCTVPVEKSTACQEFEGRIRRIHLRDAENPYNTYTHEGLPPGPISNPGRAALAAVFAPERSRFLYFVARNDGTHHFSATREEHERAVDLYIRGGAVGDGQPED